jgi:hypothetical protein
MGVYHQLESGKAGTRAYGAGFLLLPKKLILSRASKLPFFLCPNELELSRLEELGVTGLAGTLVVAVLGGKIDGAVENEGAFSPS